MNGADYQSLGAVQQRAIRNQLGALDGRFVGTRYQQSAELYATFTELAESGEARSDHVPELFKSAIEQMLPGFGESFPPESFNLFVISIAGLIGAPDEIANSAESQIKKASGRDLRIARIYRKRMLAVLGQTETFLPTSNSPLAALMTMNKSLLPQISAGPWAILHLAQCLLAIQRNGN